ncbi:hypothetical protein M1506_01260 [Patescibacteria group bacterium]|nr:hypothetical protein [Patescibacteria group bacterium]
MRGTEDYLIIEEENGRMEATVAKINSKEKEIRIAKKFDAKNAKKLGRFSVMNFNKIIFALSSAHASTIQDSFKIKTPSRSESITEAELENMVFKAFWEFLNKYRSVTAKKFNVTDVSLVLTDIQATGVKIDSHNLFNPVDFRGNEVEFTLRGTFITREFYHDIVEVAKKGSLSVVEKGSVLTSLLVENESVLADVGDYKTDIFYKKGDSEMFVDEISWGTHKLKEGVSEEFGVDYETAEKLISLYSEGGASETINKHFKKALNEEFLKLISGVKTKRKKVFLYFDSMTVRREILPKENGVELFRFDEDLSRRNFRVSADENVSFDSFRNQSTLALLFYSYADPRYDVLNAMLRRRAGWLVSNF